MNDRCPTCGRKFVNRQGGPVFEKIKTMIMTSDQNEWTSATIAQAAGVELNKRTYNAINHLAKIGILKRLGRGTFTRN